MPPRKPEPPMANPPRPPMPPGPMPPGSMPPGPMPPPPRSLGRPWMPPPMQGCSVCDSAYNNFQQMNQRELMNMIQEASFAMDDVLLFLDTHPTAAAAMQYYQKVTDMRRNAVRVYQEQFGALMVDEVKGNYWNWITEKWPWEGGC